MMRDGRVVEGTIVAQSRATVTIQTPAGVQTVAKATIQRVVFGPVPDDHEKKQAEERKRQEEQKKQEELRRKQGEQQEQADQEAEQKRQEELRAREEQAAQKAQQEAAQGGPSRAGLMLRSALLPGWGQVAGGEPGIGYTLMGLTIAAVGGAGALHSQAVAAQANYNEQLMRYNLFVSQTSLANSETERLLLATALQSGLYPAFKAKVHAANTAMAFAGTLYLGQLLHVSFMAIPDSTARLDGWRWVLAAHFEL